MQGWFRIFGGNETQPDTEALAQQLRNQGIEFTGKFIGDDLGWFRADWYAAEGTEPLELERYLASEEGIRAQLNTWAAWLETREDNPHHKDLMGRMISTRQLFTLRYAGDKPEPVRQLCLRLCRFLAGVTAGVYQVDGQGFFAADGTLLVEE